MRPWLVPLRASSRLSAASRTQSSSVLYPRPPTTCCLLCVHQLPQADWALHSPLHVQRCYFSSEENRSPSSADTLTASATPSMIDEVSVGHQWPADDDGDGDECAVHLYRPQLSPEEAERRVKTELFLCLLLTITRAQDWKDMLTAAFRAETWQPHHLDAVLRGVQLNKYNTPSAFLSGCGGSSSFAPSNTALREAAAQAASTAPATSTPTSRLQRARDILLYCAEEGVLYTSVGVSMDTLDAASDAPATFLAAEQQKESRTPAPYAPAPAAAHHLLAMLLQAAQRGVDYMSTSSQRRDETAGLPIASYADVWHDLAWMELHGYHVLSHAVLDALESAVDEGGSLSRSQRSSQGSHNSADIAKASSSSFSNNDALQYASVSQRIHRLDYVRGERALLRESLRNKTRLSSGANYPTDDSSDRHRRQREVPRTDPSA